MPKLDKSLISGLRVFANFTDEDLDEVLATAQSNRFGKDTEIFSQGDQADHFFLLLSGHIRVVQTSPQGDQVIARYINEGELFGIAVAMGMTSYPASAVAAVECVALCWPNSSMAALQSRFPAFGTATSQTIGSRVQDTQKRVMEMASEQVEQRIAITLLKLGKQSGRKTETGIEIDFPITRQDIAEMTGTTLHTVSRLLSAWEHKGLVKSSRQKVTISDPHGLLLVAEHRHKK